MLAELTPASAGLTTAEHARHSGRVSNSTYQPDQQGTGAAEGEWLILHQESAKNQDNRISQHDLPASGQLQAYVCRYSIPGTGVTSASRRYTL